MPNNSLNPNPKLLIVGLHTHCVLFNGPILPLMDESCINTCHKKNQSNK